MRVDMGRHCHSESALVASPTASHRTVAERVFHHIADTGHVYDGTSFSCPMLANPHHHRNESEQKKHHKHHR